MKKPSTTATYYVIGTAKQIAFRRVARALAAVKENFTSDTVALSKSQELNLEIVYANIRV